MRERADSRGGVYGSPGRRMSIKKQKQLSMVVTFLIGAAVAFVYHSNSRQNLPITRANTPQTVQPALVAPVPVRVERPLADIEQEFPVSGTTQWYRETRPHQLTGILRIMDTSDAPGNKVVRIRDAFGTPVAQTYIRNQEGVQLLLPLGRYEMTIALGDIWYGPEKQFGDKAHYFQTIGADVVDGEANYRILPGDGGGKPLIPIQSEAF